MKRSGFLSRSTKLRPVNPERQAKRTKLSGSTLPKRAAPLRKSGPTKAKKVARQKAFYSSAVWKRLRKEALERAGHQCEYSTPGSIHGVACYTAPVAWRCAITENLQVHHASNARFGGGERPEDLRCLCSYHHAIVELRDHPHRHPKRYVA